MWSESIFISFFSPLQIHSTFHTWIVFRITTGTLFTTRGLLLLKVKIAKQYSVFSCHKCFLTDFFTAMTIFAVPIAN